MQISVDSFTQEEISYTLTLTEGAITSYYCLAFTQSSLACKHMFLAQCITMFNIYFENVTLPAEVYHLILQMASENHLREKQQLLEKIKNVISHMNNEAV
jgi:ABC-type uncharacterized transport system permease subunit